MKLDKLVRRINEIDEKNLIGPWSAVDLFMELIFILAVIAGIFINCSMVESMRMS